MPTMIAGQNNGRTIPSYDLLEEMLESYGTSARTAHQCIHVFLADIIDRGDEDAIISITPQRSEPDDDNPHDADRIVWLEITDAAADKIREAFDALYTFTEIIGTTAHRHIARIGTNDGTATGDVYCNVMVTKAAGDGDPLFVADLPVRFDEDDRLIMDAADQALKAAGWERVGDWEYVPRGLSANAVHCGKILTP